VSARVGNFLGAGRPLAARRAARVGAAAAAASQGALAAAALAARRSLGFAFTADPAVAAAAAPVVAVMAVCMVGDGVNAVLGGALRGAGRQALGAALYVASFWAVGLPVAAALAFAARLGVLGLWTGLALAATLNAGVMVWYFAARLSWRREAERAAAAAAAAGGGDLAFGGDIEFARSGPLPAEALAPPLERMA
jgi:MATE family multidrug resistance protein